MDSAPPVLVPPLAALIVAVMATGLAWMVATPLVRAAESPTLPERLLRWTGQHRFVAVLAYLPLLFAGWHALWAIPLAWLGLQVTDHRVRRRVFRDSWSFAGQVTWNARAFLGAQAWWWALALAPAVLLHTDAAPATIVAAGIVLLAWLYFLHDVVRLLLGATPIAEPALLDAFAPVLARARVPRPRLLRAGARGGTLVNAFALGAVRGDAVLFLDGLLGEMTPAETAAVLAHELGHLEDFAAHRWRTYGKLPLLVVAATIATLAIGLAGWHDALGLLWCGAVLFVLVQAARRSQQHEADSDRRAVELCGDGEALIRALTIIHARTRVPRRFDPAFARQATHPSLARRIQAIRAIGGVAPPTIDPRAFADAGAPGAVVFEAERLVVVRLDEPPSDFTDVAGLVLRARQVDALPYGELSSLHVEPRREEGAVLVAADRHGQARRVRLADADVPAVQTVLDAIDPRLGPPAVQPLGSPTAGRGAALLALVFALPALAWPLAVAAIAAAIRPLVPLLSAVAAGALMTAVIHARDPLASWMPAALLALGSYTALVAWRQAGRDRASDLPFRWQWMLVTGLCAVGAAAALPSALIVQLGAANLERLHVVARALTSAAIAWAALGGLCVAVPRRWARLVSVAAFGLGIVVLAAGSNAFRDRFAPDPLIAPAPPLVVRDLTASANGRLTAAGADGGIALAPDAGHVVLAPVDGEAGRGRRYTVAGFDGWQRVIEAADVRFVDASTLLVTRRDERGLRLATEAVRAAGTAWSLRIDGVAEDVLVDTDPSGRWRLEVQTDPADGGRWVRLDGRVGTSAVARTELPAPNRGWIVRPDRGVTASGATIVSHRDVTGVIGPTSPFIWFFVELTGHSVLERLGGSAPGILARSRLQVDCVGPSLRVSDATCAARAGNETFLWELPGDAGAPRPLAAMDGWAIVVGQRDRGALIVWDGELLLAWRGTHEAVRLARGDQARPDDADDAAGHLVTLTRGDGRDEVIRYPLATPR